MTARGAKAPLPHGIAALSDRCDLIATLNDSQHKLTNFFDSTHAISYPQLTNNRIRWVDMVDGFGYTADIQRAVDAAQTSHKEMSE